MSGSKSNSRIVVLAGSVLVLVAMALPAGAKFLEGKVRKSDANRVSRPPERDLKSALSIMPIFSGQAAAGVAAGAPEPGGIAAGANQLAGTLSSQNFDLPAALRPKLDEPEPVLPARGQARKIETADPLDKLLMESQWNCLPCLQQHLRQRRDELQRQKRLQAQGNVSARLYMPEVSGNIVSGPLSAQGLSNLPEQPVSYLGALSAGNTPPEDPGENISWDYWYKRVAHGMYERWSQAPKLSGAARVRVTVYKDRSLTVQVVNTSNDSREFADKLTQTTAGLNGSALLAFPENSRRQVMIFDVSLDTGYDTNPGYTSKFAGDNEVVHARKR